MATSSRFYGAETVDPRDRLFQMSKITCLSHTTVVNTGIYRIGTFTSEL